MHTLACWLLYLFLLGAGTRLGIHATFGWKMRSICGLQPAFSVCGRLLTSRTRGGCAHAKNGDLAHRALVSASFDMSVAPQRVRFHRGFSPAACRPALVRQRDATSAFVYRQFWRFRAHPAACGRVCLPSLLDPLVPISLSCNETGSNHCVWGRRPNRSVLRCGPQSARR